jgi:hypothetical protein
MKASQSLLLLLISLALLSAKGGCSSEESNSPVIGEWTWVKTFCCGRTSAWTSVETCNCTKELLINKDGTFNLTENNSLKLEGTYSLRKGINDFQQQQGDSALTIQFNEEAPAYIEFIGDTLLLARGYMDYDNVYYVRKSSK